MEQGFTLNEYQEAARATASYPEMGDNLLYPALGIAGEAGECADKVKKYWRNKGYYRGKDLTPEERTALVKEIGDVLWYAAALSSELGITLEEVAKTNVHKLLDRTIRGVVKGEGDDR